MTSSLFLFLLVAPLHTTTPCGCPGQAPAPTPASAPCVTIVVHCEGATGDEEGTEDATVPEAPPEIQLTRLKPPAPAVALDAGATELALFTTGRTLPKGTLLVETVGLGFLENLPQNSIDTMGVKVGATKRLQVGFKTSARLVDMLDGQPGNLLILGILGINLKYQLWSEGGHSLAFNYVFPYSELVWSHHTNRGSFTVAAGTSLVTWLDLFFHDADHTDAFLRTGGVWRVSRTVRFIAEAGAFHYFNDPETVLFGSAGLRLVGDHVYFDAFTGVVGDPGDHDGGEVFLGFALGWQP